MLPNISSAQRQPEVHHVMASKHAPAVKHKRVVYKTGKVVRKAPTNGLPIHFDGVSFIFNNGLYYLHINNGYTVVRPPVGLKVRSLPKGYERIVVRGKPCYFALGIYYVFDNGYYRVIDEPIRDVTYSDSVSQVVSESVETQQGAGVNRKNFQLGKA